MITNDYNDYIFIVSNSHLARGKTQSQYYPYHEKTSRLPKAMCMFPKGISLNMKIFFPH